jgi:hypothetical protein
MAVQPESSCARVNRSKTTSFVASGLNPQQTFVHLIPSELVPGALREKASQFQYNLLAPLFGLHLAPGSASAIFCSRPPS